MLWPAHCVQDTLGADLHRDLVRIDNAIHVYKGTNPEIDSYSAFWDNMKLSKTSLDDQLRDRSVTDVYVVGMATDVCVGMFSLRMFVSLFADADRANKPRNARRVFFSFSGHGAACRGEQLSNGIDRRRMPWCE